jgi:hypothetical protein
MVPCELHIVFRPEVLGNGGGHVPNLDSVLIGREAGDALDGEILHVVRIVHCVDHEALKR